MRCSLRFPFFTAFALLLKESLDGNPNLAYIIAVSLLPDCTHEAKPDGGETMAKSGILRGGTHLTNCEMTG